jgi:hypothetical protein
MPVVCPRKSAAVRYPQLNTVILSEAKDLAPNATKAGPAAILSRPLPRSTLNPEP